MTNEELLNVLKSVRGLFANNSPFYIRKLGAPITNADQSRIDAVFIAVDAAIASEGVSASPQPRPWFPIETAPKDGRHIQAANFSGKDFGRDIGFGSGQSYQCVVHWWQWCDGTHQEEWGWYPSTGAGESDALTTLTHWKPLEEFFAAAPAQEPLEMYLCETQFLFLKPHQLYRFTVHPDCDGCKQAAAQEQPVETSPQKGKP